MSNFTPTSPMQRVQDTLFATSADLSTYMQLRLKELGEGSDPWSMMATTADQCVQITAKLRNALEDSDGMHTPHAATLAFMLTTEVYQGWRMLSRKHNFSGAGFVDDAITVMQAMMRTLWHIPNRGPFA